MKRTLEMKIRFTKAELDALSNKAKKARMSREGYCRAILNGSAVMEAPHADVPFLLRSMRQAAYSLDQALKRNQSGASDVSCFNEGLAQLSEAIRLVMDAYTPKAV